jgi:pimeloyl-ACP methyl ester carboxylesterase
MNTSLATPEGPGSVSGAPNLPVGFTGTFTSRYVDTGDLRLHAVTGGDGPPLLLVHGWPQTWYAWRMLMPALARDFSVVAVDQRGIGLSDKPQDGYDTGTLASDLVKLMDALGHRRFALYGTDVGMPVAYALAADHPDRVDRLVVSEAPLPGVSPSPPLFLPPVLNARLWHLAFNQLPVINEQLVTGREDIFFGAEFDASAGTHKLPADVVKYYVDTLAASPDALRGSFGFYRAIPAIIAQNEQRKTRRLTLPVLAVGGEESVADGAGKTMKLVADDVQTMVLVGSGHWVAEQAPEQLLAALTTFLTPYREAHNPGTQTAGGLVQLVRHTAGVRDTDPVITVMPSASAAARQVLRAYFAELASRYYGRPATGEEVAAAMREELSDDLTPPGGLLLVAVQDGAVLGCAGLRLLPATIRSPRCAWTRAATSWRRANCTRATATPKCARSAVAPTPITGS